MPYIAMQTSIPVPPEKEAAVKAQFGKAIELLGKTERWLMLSFEDHCRLWFQGDQARPSAFVVVKLFGKAPDGAYDRMTAEITRILEAELALDPDRIYVQYEEVSHWGWNGGNF